MVNHLLVNINYMATLITDTLKQKGSETFPLMNAEDVSLHSTSNKEKEITHKKNIRKSKSFR